MYPYGSKTPGGGEKPGSRVTLPKGAPATPRTEYPVPAPVPAVTVELENMRSLTVGVSTIIKPNFEPVYRKHRGVGAGTHTASRATDTDGILHVCEPRDNRANPERRPRTLDARNPHRARPHQPPQCLRQRPITHTQKRPPPANPTRVPALKHCELIQCPSALGRKLPQASLTMFGIGLFET
jgi:hypothetical protein